MVQKPNQKRERQKKKWGVPRGETITEGNKALARYVDGHQRGQKGNHKRKKKKRTQ